MWPKREAARCLLRIMFANLKKEGGKLHIISVETETEAP